MQTVPLERYVPDNGMVRIDSGKRCGENVNKLMVFHNGLSDLNLKECF
jgi:hypothetical protein